MIVIEGNGSRPSHRGDGVKESETMYCLDQVDRHAVCYAVCSYESNSMKSANPNSGIYETKTSRTLDNNGGNPACNQGGGNYIADNNIKSGKSSSADSP